MKKLLALSIILWASCAMSVPTVLTIDELFEINNFKERIRNVAFDRAPYLALLSDFEESGDFPARAALIDYMLSQMCKYNYEINPSIDYSDQKVGLEASNAASVFKIVIKNLEEFKHDVELNLRMARYLNTFEIPDKKNGQWGNRNWWNAKCGISWLRYGLVAPCANNLQSLRECLSEEQYSSYTNQFIKTAKLLDSEERLFKDALLSNHERLERWEQKMRSIKMHSINE